MTFPVVQSADNQHAATTVNDTTPTITYCTNIAADDMLICVMATDGGGVATTGWPAGWTELFSTLSGTGCRFEARWKRATGSETGTFDLTTPSEMHSWKMRRITGAHTTTAPEAGTSATGTSAAPNSPTLNPAGWDIEDTLWFAVFGMDYATAITVSTWPTSYTDNQHFLGGVNAGGAGSALATRNLASASDDPAAWLNSASEQWVAQTIAIRPAAAAVAGPVRPPLLLPQLLPN